jgi:L-seryl-tRNA(Ser) seleniumtransferase
MSQSEASPTNLHRALPSVDAMLKRLDDEISCWGREQVTALLREMLSQARQAITAGTSAAVTADSLHEQLRERLVQRNSASLKPVFNLTGTVLHTNLGRALLPAEAVAAVVEVATRPTNLEFDLDGGARGQRDSHVEALICELTGAEAATVVNNNAAAVLLVLNTLALNREVPVSRGELVEIGGSFRIPEVMQRANCSLVEVGATNRTHLKDYAAAITDQTALLMKVHTSNYRVEGFTAEVEESALADLAHSHNLPLVLDLGSGSLADFAALGLPPEPTASASINNGADLITFSGDKLLGGPQCGLIAGRRDLIERINANPLKRALRLDKMTLAALAEVLRLYRDPATLVARLPTLRHLTRTAQDITAQADALLPAVQKAFHGHYSVEVMPCNSQIGSGALPIETLASAGLCIRPLSGEDAQVRELSTKLRQLSVPVLGRISKGALWLDLRCLEQDAELQAQLELLQL